MKLATLLEEPTMIDLVTLDEGFDLDLLESMAKEHGAVIGFGGRKLGTVLSEVIYNVIEDEMSGLHIDNIKGDIELVEYDPVPKFLFMEFGYTIEYTGEKSRYYKENSMDKRGIGGIVKIDEKRNVTTVKGHSWDTSDLVVDLTDMCKRYGKMNTENFLP